MNIQTIILSIAFTLVLTVQCLAEDDNRGSGRKDIKQPSTPIVVVLESIC